MVRFWMQIWMSASLFNGVSQQVESSPVLDHWVRLFLQWLIIPGHSFVRNSGISKPDTRTSQVHPADRLPSTPGMLIPVDFIDLNFWETFYLLSRKHIQASTVHLMLWIKLQFVQIAPQFVPLHLIRMAKETSKHGSVCKGPKQKGLCRSHRSFSEYQGVHTENIQRCTCGVCQDLTRHLSGGARGTAKLPQSWWYDTVIYHYKLQKMKRIIKQWL